VTVSLCAGAFVGTAQRMEAMISLSNISRSNISCVTRHFAGS
jgi:hypothetical protein